MGKAGRWFRSFLRKSDRNPAKERQKKIGGGGKAKSLPKSGENFDRPYDEGLDANKHAIAVAAATAVVAQAALAAAHAAAEVVKLTSGGGGSLRSGDKRRVSAAVRIQSAFRAYLARRALRALKGLVKLQALVRGHIVRKQSADMLRRMQAMARIQARASATRAYPVETSTTKINLSHSHHHGTVNLRKYGEPSNFARNGDSTFKQYNSRLYGTNIINTQSSNMASEWLDQWMERNAWSNNHDDERNAKILEIDTWKPHQNSRGTARALQSSQYVPAWNDAPRLSEKILKPNPSISSEEVSSVISEKFHPESPRVHSASSRPMKGPFTPTRSECSRSFYGDYPSHPSYMANTESSRAKFRSHSAPKQRMQLEELGVNWKFGRSMWESDVVSEKDSTRPFNYKSNSSLNSGSSRRTHDVAGSYVFTSSCGH